jgi:hypothetical protein
MAKHWRWIMPDLPDQKEYWGALFVADHYDGKGRILYKFGEVRTTCFTKEECQRYIDTQPVWPAIPVPIDENGNVLEKIDGRDYRT